MAHTGLLICEDVGLRWTTPTHPSGWPGRLQATDPRPIREQVAKLAQRVATAHREENRPPPCPTGRASAAGLLPATTGAHAGTQPPTAAKRGAPPQHLPLRVWCGSSPPPQAWPRRTPQEQPSPGRHRWQRSRQPTRCSRPQLGSPQLLADLPIRNCRGQRACRFCCKRLLVDPTGTHHGRHNRLRACTQVAKRLCQTNLLPSWPTSLRLPE